MSRIALLPVALAALCSISLARGDEKRVTLTRTPNRGIQPQTVLDARGRLHLLFFQGDPKAGDLIYVRREAGASNFSAPLRVNSQPGSAVAVGTIRGGHLAIGKNGRAHVAWNGSQSAMPKNPIAGMPMLYARLNDAGSAFEPQRNLMTMTSILDGGGSLAADGQGNVYVAWHGLGKDSVKGEDNRRVWVSVSHDEGGTFSTEKPAWKEETGACACCGMRGFADRQGNAYFLYRAATEKTNRGMYLLRSSDAGETFLGRGLDNWKINICPMSSEAIAEGPGGVVAAWDTEGQIYFTRTRSTAFSPEPPHAAPGTGTDRKHPAVAVNERGEMLLVWSEGTGWNRGGALAWQLYDREGNATAESGRRTGAIPVWGLPAAVAEVDGRFTIYH